MSREYDPSMPRPIAPRSAAFTEPDQVWVPIAAKIVRGDPRELVARRVGEAEVPVVALEADPGDVAHAGERREVGVAR